MVKAKSLHLFISNPLWWCTKEKMHQNTVFNFNSSRFRSALVCKLTRDQGPYRYNIEYEEQ